MCTENGGKTRRRGGKTENLQFYEYNNEPFRPVLTND